MSYQEEKMQILNSLADIGRWIHDQLDGTSFIKKDELDAVDKAVAEASSAIDDLVKKMVIKEDNVNTHAHPEKDCFGCVLLNAKNDLRASQRQVLEEGKQ